jgi:hypothetical protein
VVVHALNGAVPGSGVGDVEDQQAGWQFLRDAHGVKRAIEAEYTAKLGEQGIAALRLLLTRLLDAAPGGPGGEEG